MARLQLSGTLQAEVKARAKSLCEYCHTDETWQYVPFTIDHVIPASLGGSSTSENLALACFHCNRRKGSAVQAIDPKTQRAVAFFNPRTQAWRDHFVWTNDGSEVQPLTSVGRATLQALDLNRERVKRIRGADVAVGRHPPAGDPVRPAER